MTDREYWRRPGGAWHARRLTRALWAVAICGRQSRGDVDTSDRVPASGHLCSSCARVIASQTDAR